jgi:hypothetical protein
MINVIIYCHDSGKIAREGRRVYHGVHGVLREGMRSGVVVRKHSELPIRSDCEQRAPTPKNSVFSGFCIPIPPCTPWFFFLRLQAIIASVYE